MWSTIVPTHNAVNIINIQYNIELLPARIDAALHFNRRLISNVHGLDTANICPTKRASLAFSECHPTDQFRIREKNHAHYLDLSQQCAAIAYQVTEDRIAASGFPSRGTNLIYIAFNNANRANPSSWCLSIRQRTYLEQSFFGCFFVVSLSSRLRLIN